MARDPPSHNDGWDEVTETVDGFRTQPYPGRYPLDYNYPVVHEGLSQQSLQDMPYTLSRHEVADLFRDSVDTARLRIQQSLAGSEKVGEVVKPKLTIDLSHKNIESIPEEIIDVLKKDVERLQLAHNQIWHLPYRFTECTPLKYLNLRGNRFKEFPKAIFKIPQLEILDLSRNTLTKIGEDIKHMKALRVLSLLNNNIGDLPPCLGLLDALKILKLAGNPLKPGLMQIVDGIDGSSSPPLTALADNEKESLLTREIKKHLKAEVATKESGEESSSDGPLDTPRPLKRNLSLRFPVKPSTNGSEYASDAKSAGFQRPPIPTRSHYRGVSGQNEFLQTAALRRPGIAPLSMGNERNRSNSESVLQATQNTKSKRMGMVTRKNVDLGPLDEVRANRNSLHFRGQSHSSVLRDKQGNGVRNGGNGFSTSPHEQERQRGTYVRRLSSLPEHRRASRSLDSIVEGAKGVLYSLHQVHQHISTLILVVKDGTSKRSSLERVYHNATSQLEHLDQELHDFDNASQDNKEANARSNSSVSYACSACIVAYRQVGHQLQRNIPHLLADGDQRYIRTLVLLLYGSLVEARNACLSLGIKFQSKEIQVVLHQRIPTIHEEGEKRRDRSLTPTREHPNPERRWRNGTAIQQPSNLNVINSPASAQSSVPLYVNGRSRSNSRTTTLTGSSASSIANTPRSTESFAMPGTLMVRSRSNSTMAVSHSILARQAVPEDPVRDVLFERIFLCLKDSVSRGLDAIPYVRDRFHDCLAVARTRDAPQNIYDLWAELVWRSEFCLDMCESLDMRLSTMGLNDPGNVRNAREFWKLCMRYINSVVDLLTGIRIAKRDELVPIDLLRALRPVHVTAREAMSDIKDSPWMRLLLNNNPATDRQGSLSVVTGSNSYSSNNNGNNISNNHNSHNNTLFHRRAPGSSGSNASPNYLLSIPATPLSAALGPAAQATVPSTPAVVSASLDRSFQGDVFQRADSLLSLQQTMIYRR